MKIDNAGEGTWSHFPESAAGNRARPLIPSGDRVVYRVLLEVRTVEKSKPEPDHLGCVCKVCFLLRFTFFMPYIPRVLFNATIVSKLISFSGIRDGFGRQPTFETNKGALCVQPRGVSQTSSLPGTNDVIVIWDASLFLGNDK